jgi:hypothetical protein
VEVGSIVLAVLLALAKVKAIAAIHKINTATVKAIEAGPTDSDGQSENQQFQRQFRAYFSMVLQIEESLLEKYKTTQKVLQDAARESEGN